MDNTEIGLDVEMASLQINERKRSFGCSVEEDANDDDKEQTGVVLRRSLRKRIRSTESDKRRVLIKPKRFETGSVSDITSCYLNRKVKRAPSTLETIFEEPKQAKTGSLLMSGKKFKRLIEFNAAPSVNEKKVKKRQMKAKKVYPNKRLRKKCFTKEFLLQKLAELDDAN